MKTTTTTTTTTNQQVGGVRRKPKVAIIGAGPGGLATARIFSRGGSANDNNATTTTNNDNTTTAAHDDDNNIHIIVFERECDIGGIWRFDRSKEVVDEKNLVDSNNNNNHHWGSNDNNSTAPASSSSTMKTIHKKKDFPMYRNLLINVPKEIMGYREYPWIKELKTKFIGHHNNDDLNTNTQNDHHFDINKTIDNDYTADIKSFVGHRDSLRYLHMYTNQFHLRQYIRTQCEIIQLTMIDVKKKNDDYDQNDKIQDKHHNNQSLLSPPNEIWPMIELQWLNRKEGMIETDIFDAVVVCNGHFALPTIPNIIGLTENFKGQRIMHSIEYDCAKPYFNNLKVLCVGGRASGADIALEISSVAKHVYLSDTGFQPPSKSTSSCSSIRKGNITWVPKTVAIIDDGSIQFDYNCPLRPNDVDIIVLCSGYDYQFKFINERSNIGYTIANHNFAEKSSSSSYFIAKDKRVMPLYEQIWHATYPNLSFVGIPQFILPFPLCEFQAEAIVHQYKMNLLLKSKPNGIDSSSSLWTTATLEHRIMMSLRDGNSGGEGKYPNGRVPYDTHYLAWSQFDYCRRMAAYAQISTATTPAAAAISAASAPNAAKKGNGGRVHPNDDVEQFLITSEAIWDHTFKERTVVDDGFPAYPDDYRKTVYHRDYKTHKFHVVSSIVPSSQKDIGVINCGNTTTTTTENDVQEEEEGTARSRL